MKFTALILLITFIQTVNSQSKPDVNRSMAISMSLSEIVADGKAPGMIATIISDNGIIAIGSAGVRKFGTNIPFPIKNVVHLGSCTKAMTATMIATLVAEGKLSWEMKLTEFMNASIIETTSVLPRQINKNQMNANSLELCRHFHKG